MINIKKSFLNYLIKCSTETSAQDSLNFIHFQTNTLGKDKNYFIPTAIR